MKANFYFWYWDSFLIWEKEKFWKTNFIQKNWEINFEIFDWNEIAMNKILNWIESQPFLWEKRLVFIKNIPAWSWDKKLNDSAIDSLITWLNSVPETTVLVFISSDPDKRTKIFKHISGICNTEFFEITNKNLFTYAKEYAKKNNINIKDDVLKILLDLTWMNLQKIASELEKLSLYKLWEEIIKEDIELLIQDTSEVNIFKITNLIAGWDKIKALNELQNILRWGEDVVYVFNLIVRQVRLLIFVHEMRDKSPDEIAKELKLAPFIVSTLRGQIKNFSLDLLLKMHKNLYEIDRRFKTWRIKWDKLLSLEIERDVILAW